MFTVEKIAQIHHKAEETITLMGRLWCTLNDRNVKAKAGFSQHVLKTCPLSSKNQEQFVGIFINMFKLAKWFLHICSMMAFRAA